MKKNIYALVGIGVFVLSSCNNLEQSPYEFISTEDAFDKINDAEHWTNGTYIHLRKTIYGAYMLCNDAQSDLLNATVNLDPYYRDLHRWESLSTSDKGIVDIWEANYQTIANINKALEGFPKITLKNDRERDLLREYTGELHLARAYVYTRLVTVFCKAYDENTASTDLGLPLETIYNIKTKNQRSSLQQTYDLILSDITKAEDLLQNKLGEVDSDTFTIDAVKALKSRVLLFMKRWQDAYKVASELIDANLYPLATSQDELREIWHNDATKESIVQLFVSAPHELPSANNNYIQEFNGKLYPDFIPSQWVVDLYENDDIRKEIFYKKTAVATNRSLFRDIYIVNKYPGNPSLSVGDTENYAHAPKIFRIAETYLIASEAAFQNNDFANAQKYLNELRQARGLQSVVLTGNDLWREIKNERLRELAFEGFRLFDLKRWKEGVVRKEPQNVKLLEGTPTNEYYELNRSPDDYRFVWPIPSRDIKYGELKQNPGW